MPLELIRQSASAEACGSTTCRYWYELDGQGSVVALTDSSGHVVDSYSYDAWGAPTSVSEQVPQRLRYRGYWYDAELGTYWLSVRQYDPQLKRFLQPDPSHQEGMASYTYADSDPLDNEDPSGLESCPAGEVLAGADGGSVCTCPANESMYEGGCQPTWSSTPLIYADGSCWPDPVNCPADQLYQTWYNGIYQAEYGSGGRLLPAAEQSVSLPAIEEMLATDPPLIGAAAGAASGAGCSAAPGTKVTFNDANTIEVQPDFWHQGDASLFDAWSVAYYVSHGAICQALGPHFHPTVVGILATLQTNCTPSQGSVTGNAWFTWECKILLGQGIAVSFNVAQASVSAFIVFTAISINLDIYLFADPELDYSTWEFEQYEYD